MSERHAETQRSITMIIDMPDGTTKAMTVSVDIICWQSPNGADYRRKTLDVITVAAQRLIRLAAGKLNS